MALISAPVYALPTDQQNVFFTAVINVMHKETIRDDGEWACLQLLVRYFENPVVEKWWRNTSANPTSHYHLDAVPAMVMLYSWEDSREFAIRQFQENRNDMKYARSVIIGLKGRLWRLTDRESLKIDLDIPAEDLNQMIEIILNGSPLGCFRTESVRMESLSVLFRGAVF